MRRRHPHVAVAIQWRPGAIRPCPKTTPSCRSPLDNLALSMWCVVGAAGFEPTTCSTQNCRATRLRYTPIIWETTSIHASSAASKAPAGRFNTHCFQRALFSMGIEERMSDPVAGLDAVFFRGACDYLQHPLHQPSRRDNLGRQRLSVLGNPENPAVGANENHVERDV